MRGKIRQLEEALDCSFLTSEHVFIRTMMLPVIDGYTARISELTARIGQLTEPYWHQIEQLDAVPAPGSSPPRTSRLGYKVTLEPLTPDTGQAVPAVS